MSTDRDTADQYARAVERQAAQAAARIAAEAPKVPDTSRPVRPAPQAVQLPGVAQDVAAEIEAGRKLRADFRAALFTLGKSEHRRRPIDPVERFRRNAARRRAAGQKGVPTIASRRPAAVREFAVRGLLRKVEVAA